MLDKLADEKIWKYFLEISKIPRPSKHEEKISKYILDFGKERKVKVNTDKAGNILISKNATPGKERTQTVTLQAHLDMVCEKNEGTEHDFFNDPLDLFVEDGFIKARGTTLGADNGIGVAAALAVLDSSDISHGPIECLFTVDEETGLTGANALESGFFQGRTLLNLDSEEEGAVYIGCAGGKTTGLFKAITTRKNNDKELSYKIIINGLKGGHSGLHINTGRGNAVILLARLLWNLNDKMNFDLESFNGGDKHNAIPREAAATVCFNEEEMPIFETEIIKYDEIFKKEFAVTDGNVSINKIKVELPDKVLTEKDKSDLLNLIYSFPHGVCSMDPEIRGLVQTSTNLASVKISQDGINILSSQRSSVESMVHDISGKVISHALLADYDYISKDPYPAWTPDTDSPVLNAAKKVHTDLFGKEPEVKAVHAGLECGLIGKKYPGIDMISFGPDIYGAHSPDEKMRIDSVTNFWKFLKSLIESL
ncbi:MAG: aminoacyl-histidine dipeptidase [Candidatus Delongbacteria bacterium]|nr:aminoacyl-histidine dipeptidase [Candidatus Delongbacteria bacterium]